MEVFDLSHGVSTLSVDGFLQEHLLPTCSAEIRRYVDARIRQSPKSYAKLLARMYSCGMVEFSHNAGIAKV